MFDDPHAPRAIAESRPLDLGVTVGRGVLAAHGSTGAGETGSPTFTSRWKVTWGRGHGDSNAAVRILGADRLRVRPLGVDDQPVIQDQPSNFDDQRADGGGVFRDEERLKVDVAGSSLIGLNPDGLQEW